MSKSMSVQFEDGTSQTYDNVPDDVTQEQVSARAKQDNPSKNITTISEGAHPDAPPPEPQGQGPSTATQAGAIGQQVFEGANQFLSSPVGHLLEGAAAAGYGGSKLGSAAKAFSNSSGLNSRIDQGLDLLKQHLDVNQAREARLNNRPGFGGTPQSAPQAMPQQAAQAMPQQAPQILDAQGRPMAPSAPRPVMPQAAPSGPVAPNAMNTPKPPPIGGPAAQEGSSFIQRMTQTAKSVMPAMENLTKGASAVLNNPVTRFVTGPVGTGAALMAHSGNLNQGEDAELRRRQDLARIHNYIQQNTRRQQ